jgi:phosphoribosylpyrophosphate synthetase
MKIILGPASTNLGKQVAQIIKAETVPVAFKTFPDGENYLRLEGQMQNEDVALLKTLGSFN